TRRWKSDGAAATTNAAGGDRLEPRPAPRARAPSPTAARGLLRRLDPGGGGSGVFGRGGRRARTPRPTGRQIARSGGRRRARAVSVAGDDSTLRAGEARGLRGSRIDARASPRLVRRAGRASGAAPH